MDATTASCPGTPTNPYAPGSDCGTGGDYAPAEDFAPVEDCPGGDCGVEEFDEFTSLLTDLEDFFAALS